MKIIYHIPYYTQYTIHKYTTRYRPSAGHANNIILKYSRREYIGVQKYYVYRFLHYNNYVTQIHNPHFILYNFDFFDFFDFLSIIKLFSL